MVKRCNVWHGKKWQCDHDGLKNEPTLRTRPFHVNDVASDRSSNMMRQSMGPDCAFALFTLMLLLEKRLRILATVALRIYR